MSHDPRHYEDADNETLCTWLAGWLSLGGCFWGLLLLPVFPMTWDRPDVFMVTTLMFAPGYLLTVGYVLRVCNIAKSRAARRAVWGASLAIQGVWTLVGLYGSVGPVLTFWWMFATFASVVGLLVDSSTPDVQPTLKTSDSVAPGETEPNEAQRLRLAD